MKWTVKIWDGFSNREEPREGTYEQVRNTLAGLPESHIWSIEPAQKVPSCDGLPGDTPLGMSVGSKKEANMTRTNGLDVFDYQLLARLQQDCEYYLGAGARNKKHLWALDEASQIQKMRALYAGLPEKPEWITLEDIEEYEAAMLRPQVEINKANEA